MRISIKSITHLDQHLTECHDSLTQVRRERGQKTVRALTCITVFYNPHVTYLVRMLHPISHVYSYIPDSQGSPSPSNRCTQISEGIFLLSHSKRNRRTLTKMGRRCQLSATSLERRSRGSQQSSSRGEAEDHSGEEEIAGSRRRRRR